MDFEYQNIEEQDKNLATVERIWTELLEHQATRHDTLVAIGGGATIDTVGFAAATYKRGMNWVAVPTTLLSMVDAGTGGKTGVNFGGLKNAIGSFYPPREVRIDPHYLDTLPAEEMLSGFGEMLKHALLDSTEHLNEVLRTMTDWMAYPNRQPSQFMEPLIHQSRAVKLRIVEQDPTEQGLRKALNLGHTVGHALEELSHINHRPLRHGYAVVYGLVAELYMSHVLLGLDKTVVTTISHLIPEYYPRLQESCKSVDQLCALMANDKKGPRNFTLLRAIGLPEVNHEFHDDLLISEALNYLFSL